MVDGRPTRIGALVVAALALLAGGQIAATGPAVWASKPSLHPTAAASPSCTSLGPIGVMDDGVVLLLSLIHI